MSLKLNQKLLEDIRLQRQLLELNEQQQQKSPIHGFLLPGSSGFLISDSRARYRPKGEKVDRQDQAEKASKSSNRKKKGRVEKESRRQLDALGALSFRKESPYDTISLFSDNENNEQHRADYSNSRGTSHHHGRRSLDLGEVARHSLLDPEYPYQDYSGNVGGESYTQIKAISRDAKRLTEILHGWKKNQQKNGSTDITKKASDLEESLQLLARLQKATAKLNNVAEAPRKSVDLRGFSDEKPRMSFESSKSAGVDLRDAIRASLNRQKLLYSDEEHAAKHKSSSQISHGFRKSSASSSQEKKRIPNVVARLMGLEELPAETKRPSTPTPKESHKGKSQRPTTPENSRQQMFSAAAGPPKLDSDPVRMLIKGITEAHRPVQNPRHVDILSGDHEAARTVQEILQAIHIKGVLGSFNRRSLRDAEDHVPRSNSLSPVKGKSSFHETVEILSPQRTQSKATELHQKTTAASRNRQGSAVKSPVKKHSIEENSRRSTLISSDVPKHEYHQEQEHETHKKPTVSRSSHRRLPAPPPAPPPPPPRLAVPPSPSTPLQDFRRNAERVSKAAKGISPERSKPVQDHVALSRKTQKGNVEPKPSAGAGNRKQYEEKLEGKIALKLAEVLEQPTSNSSQANGRKHNTFSASSTRKIAESSFVATKAEAIKERVPTHGSTDSPEGPPPNDLTANNSEAVAIVDVLEVPNPPVVDVQVVEPYVPAEQIQGHEEDVKHALLDSETSVIFSAPAEEAVVGYKPSPPSLAILTDVEELQAQNPKKELIEETPSPSDSQNYRTYITRILCTDSESKIMDPAELYSQIFFKIEEEEEAWDRKEPEREAEEAEILNRQLLLDCLKELLRRKTRLHIERKQALGLSSIFPCRIPRCRRLSQAVQELCLDIEALLKYHERNDDEKAENDWLYEMLQRDLGLTRSGLDSVWSRSWDQGTCGPEEVQEIGRELERHLLHDLIDEFVSELKGRPVRLSTGSAACTNLEVVPLVCV